jgi:DNA-binding NarL/FixJ family response regulator
MSDIRVVIADDDVLLREGMSSLLTDAGLNVVGRAGDAEELIALLARDQPDLAIIDIRMPPSYTAEGLDAALRIRSEFPDVALLLLPTIA